MPQTIGTASSSPVGTVTKTASSVAPFGWLLCDGSEISRTTYSDLFAAIGTTYGIGDGSTTFNIPDARGKSALGVNNVGLPNGENVSFSTRDLADTGGEEDHILSSAEGPSHAHNVSGVDPGHDRLGVGVIAFNDVVDGTIGSTHVVSNDAPTSTPSQNVSTGITNTASAGNGDAHNTMHPFVVFNYIIKY